VLLRTCGNRDYRFVIAALTGGDEFAEKLRSLGATVYLLQKKHKFDLSVIKRISDTIEQEKVDICHFHNSSASFWGIISLRLTGRRLPIARTEHSPFSREMQPMYLRAIYPLILKNSDITVCVSERVRKTFSDRFPRFSSKLKTIHNGIIVEDFVSGPSRTQARKSLGIEEDSIVIGTVGRLVRVKNQSLLIEAFAGIAGSHPSCRLLIAGEGPMMDRLSALAQTLGIKDRLLLTGKVTDINLVYRALDIFVLTSSIEGLPLALLEAMASGLPTISTDVGAISEVIEDGKTGIVVPPGDSRVLQSALEELLNNPDRAREMGELARKRVEEKFNAEKTARLYETLYRNLTENM